MSLKLTREDQIYKKLFDLKTQHRDGLIINIHHNSSKYEKTRISRATFNNTREILVLADNAGSLFMVDFSAKKFWNLPQIVDNLTLVKFSTFNSAEILVGTYTGWIYILDIEAGTVSGELIGHNYPPISVSFSQEFLCLSSSLHEAIIWDLRTNSKLHVMNLDAGSKLKFAVFMPVSSNILSCYHDDILQVWHYDTFEMKTQIDPVVWYKHLIRNITFTRDGKSMVLACRSTHLALFLLRSYKLLKLITLPEHIQAIRHAEFIPHLNDGGSHNILAILSSRGIIYFYNIEDNVIMSELSTDCEISRFDFCVKGSLLACVLSSGQVNVYDIHQYTMVPMKTQMSKARSLDKSAKLNRCLEKMGAVKHAIKEMLGVEKLTQILNHRGQYPDVYRNKIWEQLLELPNQRHTYNAIINNRMMSSFEELYQVYPLENKRHLKNLRKLLDNIVTWCAFFRNVDFLPSFVFPFVKVFTNQPLICFEAVCTVIINWCQYWFEYYPLPPINILAMIENVLMEHDADLLTYFSRHNISSRIYAWPILKTAFSEVLSGNNWRIFWDHVLTNEPAFLLCGVVAYNCLKRTAIFGLNDEKQFVYFYYTHHPVDIKKLLSRTYHILSTTSREMHPRQYLSKFKRIEPGLYPEFYDYPEALVGFKEEKEGQLKSQIEEIHEDQADLLKRKLRSLAEIESLDNRREEERRISEMEKAVKEKLLKEQENVKKERRNVNRLKDEYVEEESVLTTVKKNMLHDVDTSRSRFAASLNHELTGEGDFMKKSEVDLLNNYSELLKSKYSIGEMGESKTMMESLPTSAFEKHQTKLSQEIDSIRHENSISSVEHLKTLNLLTGVTAMDALIEKIESEVAKERRGYVPENTADRRVLMLQAETKDLLLEVNKLLEILVQLRKK